jgi:hypothetical protein
MRNRCWSRGTLTIFFVGKGSAVDAAEPFGRDMVKCVSSRPYQGTLEIVKQALDERTGLGGFA